MKLRFRAIEDVDRRVLGAVRFLDAGTGRRIERPLEVEAPGVRWIRNRANLYVVADAPGLTFLTRQFEYPEPPPEIDPPVTVNATARDASGQYLARAFSFDLPREGEALFEPVDVALYASPSGALVAGWASLRASVADDASGAPVEGALLRVVKPGATPAEDQVLARGLSDARGEAFVPIPGIPFMTWSDDETAVLTSAVNVRIEAYADPDAARPVDPDTLEQDRASLPFDERAGVPVKAGASVTAALRIRPRTP
jgi:hypothetical protein